MPIRMIRDWTDSEAVNSLTRQAECFFTRLIMKADDFGRFHASPKLLRSLLFPVLIDSVRDADCARWLAECEKAGLVRVFKADGKTYLEINKFDQRLRAKLSKFPSPPPSFDSNMRADDGMLPQDADMCPPEWNRGENTNTNTNTNGKEDSCSKASETEALEPEVPLLIFPVVGPDNSPKEWPLMESKIREYQLSYPGVDVLAECKKALQWCKDNTSSRKTFAGMPRFLNSWMGRSQNEPRKLPGFSARDVSGGRGANFRDGDQPQGGVVSNF